MSTPIGAGFLSNTEAMALTAGLSMAEATARLLAKLEPYLTDEFPVAITAWDAATQSATWYEQDYDANGARKTRPNGRTGGPTYRPLKPVGNGLMPPDAFPVEVWARRRVKTDARGEVYEFDWVCACAGAPASGGSGGGGGTGVLTGCCPGAVPRQLTATITVTAGSCPEMNGAAWVLDYSDATSRWAGVRTFVGTIDNIQLELACTGGTWAVIMTSFVAGCGLTGPTSVSLESCAPLHLTAHGVTVAGTCGVCASAVWDVTVTE